MTDTLTRPDEHAPLIPSDVYGRRWPILAVLCVALLIVGIDGTIVNVALPELRARAARVAEPAAVDQRRVHARVRELSAHRRERSATSSAGAARCSFGLVVFGLGSLGGALVGSAGALIATRAIQGFGGAFIMPSTLSILTNVFPDDERGRAIGIWSGVSGLGVAIGPLVGGYLLDHFWWGSVFLVNLPVIAVAIVAVIAIVPDSKDPNARPIDVARHACCRSAR